MGALIIFYAVCIVLNIATLIVNFGHKTAWHWFALTGLSAAPTHLTMLTLAGAAMASDNPQRGWLGVGIGTIYLGVIGVIMARYIRRNTFSHTAITSTTSALIAIPTSASVYMFLCQRALGLPETTNTIEYYLGTISAFAYVGIITAVIAAFLRPARYSLGDAQTNTIAAYTLASISWVILLSVIAAQSIHYTSEFIHHRNTTRAHTQAVGLFDKYAPITPALDALPEQWSCDDTPALAQSDTPDTFVRTYHCAMKYKDAKAINTPYQDEIVLPNGVASTQSQTVLRRAAQYTHNQLHTLNPAEMQCATAPDNPHASQCTFILPQNTNTTVHVDYAGKNNIITPALTMEIATTATINDPEFLDLADAAGVNTL